MGKKVVFTGFPTSGCPKKYVGYIPDVVKVRNVTCGGENEEDC